MGYERLAYDDQDTTGQMHDDCAACASQMQLPRQRIASPGAHDKHKAEIEISDATAYLASRLHLHLD